MLSCNQTDWDRLFRLALEQPPAPLVMPVQTAISGQHFWDFPRLPSQEDLSLKGICENLEGQSGPAVSAVWTQERGNQEHSHRSSHLPPVQLLPGLASTGGRASIHSPQDFSTYCLLCHHQSAPMMAQRPHADWFQLESSETNRMLSGHYKKFQAKGKGYLWMLQGYVLYWLINYSKRCVF